MHIKYWEELKKDTFGKIGLVLFLFFIVIVLIAPFITRDPQVQTALVFEAPSLEHLLGTNDVGQDIWSRLVWGARTSLLVAIGVGMLSTFLGALIGASAALIGGWYEEIAMRIIDAFLVIPTVILLILVAAFIRPSIWLLIVLISFLRWQGGARIIRSQTLSLKESVHISAAKSFGASRFYILFRHIIPDLAPILVVSFIYSARMAVFMEAGLAFIGITDPSVVSWGKMMHHALNFYYLDIWKWWLLPAGMALSALILVFAFLGYSLEKIMDPRLRKSNA
ncbi:ABC transporter permease [Candidatus Aerophobetes bacterium]|nr:ABC transporter permease [Candidatus Aerophobetes bacterium]